MTTAEKKALVDSLFLLVKKEALQKRPCLGDSGNCLKLVYGHNGNRMCDKCKDHVGGVLQ